MHLRQQYLLSFKYNDIILVVYIHVFFKDMLFVQNFVKKKKKKEFAHACRERKTVFRVKEIQSGKKGIFLSYLCDF